jgi:hypothetical protein
MLIIFLLLIVFLLMKNTSDTRVVKHDVFPVADEVVCKHWLVAGAMKGFVTPWELHVSFYHHESVCHAPSLYPVTCCSDWTNDWYYYNYYKSKDGKKVHSLEKKNEESSEEVSDETQYLWELDHVPDPICCFTSDACCQPVKLVTEQAAKELRSGNESAITRRNQSRVVYRPADPANNSYADLFKQGFNKDIQETQKIDQLTKHDIMVICLTGSMIIRAFIAGALLMYLHHKREQSKIKPAVTYNPLKDPAIH